MLLSGFTFIRNAVKFDFPVVECIESMLPIVDELIVNVGNSEDETEALIKSISSPKIKIIHSVWDDTKTKDGLILSEQTNIALNACSGRWALYLQADEALHESEHEKILHTIKEEDKKTDPVEGFKFKYLHFYSGYSLVQRAWNWYPNEIRIIRRNSGAMSFGDAQTFRIPKSAASTAEFSELTTATMAAHVFHYGHAREPEQMKQKIHYFHRFWHGDKHGITVESAYKQSLKELTWYWGSHPSSYNRRIDAGKAWSLTPKKLIQNVFGDSPIQRIVIVADPANLVFARSLKNQIDEHYFEQEPSPKTYLISRVHEWLGFMFKNAFSRKTSALIDLYSEKKPFMIFICWVWDTLCAFRWRVAHAPEGRLSKFRRRFYTAVNWGCHEMAVIRREHSFSVPEDRQISQLLKWIGID